MIRIRQGLDIPMGGTPVQQISDAAPVHSVALLGRDYHGYKRLPTVLVKEGDRVRLGQPMARGKHFTDITVNSPAAGVVEQIVRGERRFLETIIIRLEGQEEDTFNGWRPEELADLNREQVQENLLASGLWLSFRTRPYGLVAEPDSESFAIFVNAMDSNPLAADPAVIIAEAPEAFCQGLTVISKLTPGKVYMVKAAGADIPVSDDPSVVTEEFAGPHPAGLVGTHIHFLAPVDAQRSVWYLNYQDVIAIGRLFTSGRLSTERIVALAGPAVIKPRLIRTRLGANTNELLVNELHPGEARVVSGSILSGHQAVGAAAFLGRYDSQISVLGEGRKRELFGWLSPGLDKFSASNVFLSSLFRNRCFDLSTSQNGSFRAMVPIGSYERVMPLDILPTQLLRALVIKDTESAQALGCLELEEEDLALCTFVDTGKYDFGPILRKNLDHIMKEG